MTSLRQSIAYSIQSDILFNISKNIMRPIASIQNHKESERRDPQSQLSHKFPIKLKSPSRSNSSFIGEKTNFKKKCKQNIENDRKDVGLFIKYCENPKGLKIHSNGRYSEQAKKQQNALRKQSSKLAQQSQQVFHNPHGDLLRYASTSRSNKLSFHYLPAKEDILPVKPVVSFIKETESFLKPQLKEQRISFNHESSVLIREKNEVEQLRECYQTELKSIRQFQKEITEKNQQLKTLLQNSQKSIKLKDMESHKTIIQGLAIPYPTEQIQKQSIQVQTSRITEEVQDVMQKKCKFTICENQQCQITINNVKSSQESEGDQQSILNKDIFVSEQVILEQDHGHFTEIQQKKLEVVGMRLVDQNQKDVFEGCIDTYEKQDTEKQFQEYKVLQEQYVQEALQNNQTNQTHIPPLIEEKIQHYNLEKISTQVEPKLEGPLQEGNQKEYDQSLSVLDEKFNQHHEDQQEQDKKQQYFQEKKDIQSHSETKQKVSSSLKSSEGLGSYSARQRLGPKEGRMCNKWYL